MGWYITFSKQDILNNLGAAVPEAQGQDMGIPQADPVASPTMTDVRAAQQSHRNLKADDTIPLLPGHQSEDRGTPPADSTTSLAMANAEDTQSSPMEALQADKNTVPFAKFNAEAKQDLPTTRNASPAKSGNQVTPTAGSASESAGPLPHLAFQQKKNKV